MNIPNLFARFCDKLLDKKYKKTPTQTQNVFDKVTSNLDIVMIRVI